MENMTDASYYNCSSVAECARLIDIYNCSSLEDCVKRGLVNVSELYSCSSEDGNCEDIDPFAMPGWRKFLYTVMFFIMVATADIGNIIVIWIVLSDKRMRSVTNYFLVNLSTADIINATFNVIPNFTYMLIGNWHFGWFYCKVGTSLSLLSVTCSVFTLVAISVDRYNAIINPLRPRLSRFKTIIIATSIWVIGVNISLPALLYQTAVLDEDTNMTHCVSRWPDAMGFESKMEYRYNVSYMIITYFLPMITMLYTYSRISIELWGSRAIGEATSIQLENIKSKRKVVKMMVFVVIIFCVCWLPYHTYFILAHLYPQINNGHYIQDIYLCIYWLAMSNSMYNPMIYCYMNQRFRKGFGLAMSFFNPLRCFSKQNVSYSNNKDKSGMNGVKMCHLNVTPRRMNNSDVGPDSLRSTPRIDQKLSPSLHTDSGSSNESGRKFLDQRTIAGRMDGKLGGKETRPCLAEPSTVQRNGVPQDNQLSIDKSTRGQSNPTLMVDDILSRASRLAVDRICISVCKSSDQPAPQAYQSEFKPCRFHQVLSDLKETPIGSTTPTTAVKRPNRSRRNRGLFKRKTIEICDIRDLNKVVRSHVMRTRSETSPGEEWDINEMNSEDDLVTKDTDLFNHRQTNGHANGSLSIPDKGVEELF